MCGEQKGEQQRNHCVEDNVYRYSYKAYTFTRAAIYPYEGIVVRIRGYRAITICDDIAILDGQIDVFATGGTSRHEII